MTLEDECKRLMFYREKIKEFKKGENEAKNAIILYLKNHNQGGVIFKHNNKQITLLVESTTTKKNISKKEKEKMVQKVLVNAGVQNVDITTQEIINSLQQPLNLDRPSMDKLKFKTTK